jgi:hypothetical protein
LTALQNKTKSLANWEATAGAQPLSLFFEKVLRMGNCSLDLFVSFTVQRKTKRKTLNKNRVLGLYGTTDPQGNV